MVDHKPPANALTSVFWAIVQSLVGRLIVFLLFMILARLLLPEDFGIAAASSLVLMLIGQLAEFGFGDAMVQRRSLEKEDITLPFFSALSLSIISSVIVVWQAEHIAALFKMPRLTPILSVSALIAPVMTLSSFQEALYRRGLAFKRLALRVFLSNGLGGIAAVVVALAGGGVWAFVVQTYITAIVGAVWLWSRPMWAPTLVFNVRSYKEMTMFGSRIFSTRVLDFISTRAVEFVIATVYGVAALGQYAVGSRIYQTLMQLLQATFSDVSLSLLSRIAHERDRMASIYLQTSTFSTLIGSAVFMLFAALSGEICTVLLGERWASVGDIARPLLAVGSVQCVQFLNISYLNAMGKPSIALFMNAIKIVTVLLVLVLMRGQSIPAMIFGFAVAQLITTPISFGYTVRALGLKLTALCGTLLPIFAASASGLLVVDWLRPYLLEHHIGDLPRGVLLGCAFGAWYLLALALVARRQAAMVVNLAITRMRRPAKA